MKPLMPKQCFQIDPALFHSVTEDEVTATYDAMVEAGIAQPPYPLFDLMTSANVLFQNTSNNPALEAQGQLLARYRDGIFIDLLINRAYGGPDNPRDAYDVGAQVFAITTPFYSLLDKSARAKVAANAARLGAPDSFNWTEKDDFDFVRRCNHNGAKFYRLLLVLLATRNVVKTVTVDKLAKAGIGRDKRHVHTTHIAIGQLVNTDVRERAAAPSGGMQLPQLRRGHTRRQHYGPRNQFEKMIFIEPYFTHVDQQFMNDRQAYNVSLSAN